MIILNVPYHEKDEAKALGAMWDPKIRKWYLSKSRDAMPLLKWIMRGDEGVKMEKKVLGEVKGGGRKNATARRKIRGDVRVKPLPGTGGHITIGPGYVPSDAPGLPWD